MLRRLIAPSRSSFLAVNTSANNIHRHAPATNHAISPAMSHFTLPTLLLVMLAQAKPVPHFMGDAEIDRAFRGVTLKGEYADLSLWTESYLENGEADYEDARGPVKGQWSVVNGHFCTLYEEVITGGCFKAVHKSSNCFEFYSSANTPGETTDPKGDQHWVARAWNKDKPSTCTVETV
jgi:hypothetical protein